MVIPSTFLSITLMRFVFGDDFLPLMSFVLVYDSVIALIAALIFSWCESCLSNVSIKFVLRHYNF